jgi:hypothetical protein
LARSTAVIQRDTIETVDARSTPSVDPTDGTDQTSGTTVGRNVIWRIDNTAVRRVDASANACVSHSLGIADTATGASLVQWRVRLTSILTRVQTDAIETVPSCAAPSVDITRAK